MSLVFWPQKDLAYHPFFINDEACTVKTHVLSPIEIFLSPNPIFIDDSVFWISQKSEWKVEFLSELLVLFRVIRTNAYHREAFLFSTGHNDHAGCRPEPCRWVYHLRDKSIVQFFSP